jgi:hypothetical protein
MPLKEPERRDDVIHKRGRLRYPFHIHICCSTGTIICSGLARSYICNCIRNRRLFLEDGWMEGENSDGDS